MMWEFKNNKNTIEAAKNISTVYGQCVIIDHQVLNQFSNFYFGKT